MTALSTERIPSDSPALIAEILRLKADIGRNLWRMGKCLARLEENEASWKPKYKRWEVFTQDVLGLTGHYCHKLADVVNQFSEEEVLECGATKLIRILPVPKEHRAQFVEKARTASCSELRADLNRFTVERVKSEGRLLPTRDTGRRVQRRTREILYLEPGEQIVALYAGSPRSGTRAKRVEDRPAGRAVLGGKAYVISLRSSESGLVVGIKLARGEQ